MFKLKKNLIQTGKIIYELGLIDSHSGNMSVCKGNQMMVSASGSMLGYLNLEDIIEFNMNSKIPEAASSETCVHRQIYRKTDANAIIHTHSFYSLLLSFYYDKIIPEDSEGLFFNPEVPILDCGNITVGSACVEDNISELLVKSPVVIIRGHGVFSAGKDLDCALKHLSALENSCKLIYFKSNFSKNWRKT
ncbi:class II aldolase/adducin family protein [bacterium]|nr:class II aldolase/adducin family protein [bacterium]